MRFHALTIQPCGKRGSLNFFLCHVQFETTIDVETTFLWKKIIHTFFLWVAALTSHNVLYTIVKNVGTYSGHFHHNTEIPSYLNDVRNFDLRKKNISLLKKLTIIISI